MKLKMAVVGQVLVAMTLSLSAETFLKESFVIGFGDASNGEYKQATLKDPGNVSVESGSIVGFSKEMPWVGKSALPLVSAGGLSSMTVPGAGGMVLFRGNDTDGKRAFGRKLERYKAPPVLYFSGTLRADILDDNALSLIAYSVWDNLVDRLALHVMESYDFKGIALGFKGDGEGGMDFIARCRNNSNIFTDTVLVENVDAHTAYTVVGKINWNAGSFGSETVTLWINPQGGAEPEGGTVIDADLGDTDTIEAVYFMQTDFGKNIRQSVAVDELRLTSSFKEIQ